MPNRTFIDSCLAGDASPEDIDDWIDRWHSSETGDSLNTFLGFTQDEGALFVERPGSLRSIIAARHQKPLSPTADIEDEGTVPATQANIIVNRSRSTRAN